MNSNFVKYLLFVAVFFIVISGKSQDNDKFGANPDQCKMDASEYKEFVKQKNYVDAVRAWRKVFKECPKAYKAIYIDGSKIYKSFIKKEKDAVKKAALVDTLMMIYDQRVQYFGQKAYVYGRKGADMYRYNKKNYEEAYRLMKFSIDSGKKIQPAVLQYYMTASARMYKNKKNDAGKVVQDFSLVSDKLAILIEKNKDNEKKLAKLKKTEENIGKIFIATGAGSCEVLVAHFTPKFEATPQDTDLLKTITKYLAKGECTESKLFFDASVALYNLSPSANAAYNIAKIAVKKKEMSKAIEFYKKAIEGETDKEKKANYYYELAVISVNSPAASREYIMKAIDLKPNWGDPYLFLGKLYAGSASKCGESKFQHAAVYWLAVDQFIKAKSIDPSIAVKANKLIATYKSYFPNKEDAFFYNVTAGDTYSIECWINRKTKARF